MPTVITRGGMSAQGFGFGAVASKLYVEDVFSTYLYTGNSSTRNIANGIDLSGKGGLVWIKTRNTAKFHFLCNTANGATNYTNSASTNQQFTDSSSLTAFLSDGFALGIDNIENSVNTNPNTYVSWTFRKAPKFFDVVTWTGNGANRTIAHNLGVAPGCIIVKRTDTTADWQVYHRSNANTEYMVLNTTAAKATGTTRWNSTTPTATEFTVGTDTTVNASGGTYVAYLFAHDATANGIIQCGSFTTDGSDNATVNLGWEPQFVMVKQSSATSDWAMLDTMRGWPVTATDAWLRANSSAAENVETTDYISPTSTGFQVKGMWGTPGGTSVYIVIRRGPMKTPTVGTSVFLPSTVGATNNITVGFPADTYLIGRDSANWRMFDRLRSGFELSTNTTNAEGTFNYAPTYIDWDSNSVWYQNLQNAPLTNYFFRRAPSFFDEVCYTGTGVARTVDHNLGVAPELLIVKRRNSTGSWTVRPPLAGNTNFLFLQSDAANGNDAGAYWNSTAPTTTNFTVGENVNNVNGSGSTYVAYLFASCPGVSKVGSYTGNGSSQTINCGFSSGARFFLVKRTDSSGSWYVWDSADGIVSGNDPYRMLNDTIYGSADAVDPDSSGIIVNQETTCNINVNGATYIFLAVA